jgi:hypothetical protein
MSSAAQALANQENAQLSTGPRTPDGKRASSLNAIRHGLTSQLLVLPGEDHAPYEAFRVKLLAELAPRGTVEDMLAETVCSTHWRLERARKAELNLLALAQYEDLPPAIDTIDDPALRTAMIEAHASVKYERALRNIQIHEARLRSGVFKAIEQFRQAQSERQAADRFHMSAAINARNSHLAQERYFRPADHGFVFTTAQIDRAIDRRFMQTNPRSCFGPPQISTYTQMMSDNCEGDSDLHEKQPEQVAEKIAAQTA